MVDFLVATIADIRGFIKSATAFPLKIGAGLVKGRARSAFDTADENLPTGIGLFAVIAMDAEVFRDGSRIFAQVFSHIFEGTAFIQGVFNVYTVFKGKMFLVARNIFAHKISYCCQKVILGK